MFWTFFLVVMTCVDSVVIDHYSVQGVIEQKAKQTHAKMQYGCVTMLSLSGGYWRVVAG